MPQSVWNRKKAEHILALRKQHLSMREIGMQLKPPMTKQRVSQYLARCRKEGYDVPDIQVISADCRRQFIDEKAVKRILAAWPKDGRCRCQDIATKARTTIWLVRRVRREYNLPLVVAYPRTKIPPEKRPSVKKAYENGTPAKELAKKYKVTVGAIYNLLRQLKHKAKT